MNKLAVAILVAASVNPTSIHWSANGNYLVDQNGKRTTVQGHPAMVCYQNGTELHGKFIKADGAVILLKTPAGWFTIHKPVCDLYQ